LNFYHYVGNVGTYLANTSNGTLSSRQPLEEFRYGNDLTGDGMRARMETAPRMGMKLRPDTKRSFFEQITIYDLGMEPDRVNIYYFVTPTITQFNHENLDYEGRTEKQTMQMNFEYEAYYFLLGQNRRSIPQVFEDVLGIQLNVPVRTRDGHILMHTQNRGFRDPVGGQAYQSAVAQNPDTGIPTPASGSTDPGDGTGVPPIIPVTTGPLPPVLPVQSGAAPAGPSARVIESQITRSQQDLRDLQLQQEILQNNTAPSTGFISDLIKQNQNEQVATIDRITTLSRSQSTLSKQSTPSALATNDVTKRLKTMIG